jgi:hypothetical protein
MDTSKLAKPLALLSAAAALLLAPTSAKGGQAVGTATICATGTCCPSVGSKCYPNDQTYHEDYYYKKEGSCAS